MKNKFYSLIKCVFCCLLIICYGPVHAEPFFLSASCSKQTIGSAGGLCTLYVNFSDKNLGSPTLLDGVVYFVNGAPEYFLTYDTRNLDGQTTGQVFQSLAETKPFQVSCGKAFVIRPFIREHGITGLKDTEAAVAVNCPK